MKIIKKDGSKQSFNPNKVLTRIKRSGKGLKIDCDVLSQKVIPQIRDNMTTIDIDNLVIIESLGCIWKHPDYSNLASSIMVDLMHKEINIEERKFPFDLEDSRDYESDYLALSTFKDKYRYKSETLQEFYARVACELESDDEKAKELYDLLSTRQLNFATPINLTAGTGNNMNRFISCDINFLIDDDTDSIEDTMKELAKSSRDGSGIGIYVGNLRSKKTKIGSYDGFASGVVRLADKIQAQARFYNQRGKRNGAIAIYLPIWHKDIIGHVSLRLNEGDERLRTRDVFTGVVIDDYFMNCLINEKPYHLLCPHDVKKAGLKPLYECNADEFKEVYEKAIELGLGEEIDPRHIWLEMTKSMASTGTPYTVFIDNINKVNMQKHFGMIKSSNLCVETILYADDKEVGQCSLGSIPLPYCTDIRKASSTLCYYINKVIDINVYSTGRAEKGGLGQRTVGIGVAGLAEYLYSKDLDFEKPEGHAEFKRVMREIYLGAVEGSQKYYEETGKTFRDYELSLYAENKFNPQVWGVEENEIDFTKKVSNSLFTALMPTATSSNLLSCTEGFEVPQTMVYKRKLDKGEFMVVQRNLVEELDALGLWNDNLAREVVAKGGSIQEFEEIPQKIKDKYKTSYEVSQKSRIDMVREGFPYIDQSTSLNLYFPDGDFPKISSSLIHGWKIGNKTGSYYTRVLKNDAKSKADAFNRAGSKTPKSNEGDSLFECDGCSA
jgi:ribonucleoside-diphosphate reductase alpha subunit